MGVFAEPDQWRDSNSETPPLWWEAVETDERWWFYNDTGSGGGGTATLTELVGDAVTLAEDLVLDYEVTEASASGSGGGGITFRLRESFAFPPSYSLEISIPNEVGSGQITIPAGTTFVAFEVVNHSGRMYSGVVALAEAEPPSPPLPPCEEVGRATRAYVSAYDRTRVHQSRLYRFEKRCFVANFNGALPPGRTIATATWRIDAPEIGVISNPQISDDGRESSVMFASQLGGWANMRCEVTLDNGEIYNQVFRVNVREVSWVFDDPPAQSGPFSVTVSAEEE